jgi:hypothetical protein
MFWADATAIPANNAAVLSSSLLLFIDSSFIAVVIVCPVPPIELDLFGKHGKAALCSGATLDFV